MEFSGKDVGTPVDGMLNGHSFGQEVVIPDDLYGILQGCFLRNDPDRIVTVETAVTVGNQVFPTMNEMILSGIHFEQS